MKISVKHILVCLGSLFLTLGSIHAQLDTDRITAIGRNALYFDDYILSIQYFNQVIKLKPYLSEPYLLRAIAKIQVPNLTVMLLSNVIHFNQEPITHEDLSTGKLTNLKKQKEILAKP